MSLFFQIGRRLGYATIPAIRRSKWAWHTVTGDDAQAIRSETEFGQALAAELRLKSGVSRDAADLQLVRDILHRLSERVRNKLRTFQIDLLRDPVPSAIALPGGFIFLSSGLLDFVERTPDELAFIIGHEMGHVIRGHSLQRMLKRIGAEGLSSILSRGLLNPTLRQTGLKWLESSHDQDAEFEADEFGVRLAHAGGYDPAGGLRLLQRIGAERARTKDLGSYFTSHPPESERIARLQPLLPRELRS